MEKKEDIAWSAKTSGVGFNDSGSAFRVAENALNSGNGEVNPLCFPVLPLCQIFPTLSDFGLLVRQKKIGQTSEFCRIFSKKRIFVGFFIVLDFRFLREKNFQTSKIDELFS
jgi:hypothetical protein